MTTELDENRLLTISQAAEWAQVTENVIERMVAKDELRIVDLMRGHRRIRLRDLVDATARKATVKSKLAYAGKRR